jgi:hypothetical protein
LVKCLLIEKDGTLTKENTGGTYDGNESDYTDDELAEAHRSLLSTLKKCEKVLESEKLPQSQRTLTEHRVAALKIALALIEKEQSQ